MLERLLDSLNSVVSYNGLYDSLNDIKKDLKEIELNDGNYRYECIDDIQFQVIWMILVCMFGDYGTSPRYGWLELENKDEIINFIDLITK